MPPGPEEQFDDDAEAYPDDLGAVDLGGWTFPDPAIFPLDRAPQTPLDQLVAAAAQASSPPHRARGATDAATYTPGRIPTGGDDTHQGVQSPGAAANPRVISERGQRPLPTTSALVRVCQRGRGLKTQDDLIAFLEWQSSRRGDGEEQRKFREHALAFPHLLVFATMRKKSQFIHLVHSAGIYPNIPGADPSWKGKIIGFLGDKTRFANPQLVELGKNVAWAWDDPLVSLDAAAMTTFYASPDNKDCL